MNLYQTILVERRGPVGWIIFDRPDRLNAMNVQMEYELVQAWRELESDPDVRAIVNTGRGRGFQVGVDLKEVADDGGMVGHQSAKKKYFGEAPRPGFTSRTLHVTKPVICAVNGVCAGAGFHFVTDADIVICSSKATFTEPHVTMGQVSALEPIGLLSIMPFGAVMRMVLTGAHETYGAERAFSLGMVTEVIDPPEAMEDSAQQLAEKIARNSPGAIVLTKKAIWNALEVGREQSLVDGRNLLEQFWGHPDNIEGARAFVEKREPKWSKT